MSISNLSFLFVTVPFDEAYNIYNRGLPRGWTIHIFYPIQFALIVQTSTMLNEQHYKNDINATVGDFCQDLCASHCPGGPPVCLQQYVSYHENIFPRLLLLFSHFQFESCNETAKPFHLYFCCCTTLRGLAIGSWSNNCLGHLKTTTDTTQLWTFLSSDSRN